MITRRASTVSALCAVLVLGSAAAQGQSPLLGEDSLIVGDIAFLAHSEVIGARHDSLRLSVRIQNRRDSTVAIGFGGCSMESRLARPDAGPPFVLLPPGSPTTRVQRADGTWDEMTEVCLPYLVQRSLAPRACLAGREFTWRGTTRRLASRLTPGVYRVIARIELLGRFFEIPAGDVVIDGTGPRSIRRAL
jgi:hypothetical protein